MAIDIGCPHVTETFENIVGVNAQVKFIVQEGVTGFVAKNLDDFVKYSIELIDNPEKLEKMKTQSLDFALTRSWDSVFESVYDTYRDARDYLADVRRRQKASEVEADSRA